MKCLPYVEIKTYLKVTVTKVVCYWQKDRQTDKWNRVEHPGTEP